ncbi:hypothetical protein ILYODFUR_018267 [Ilyodon furcidens]|uniref:Secreted protein n=1 Tax=Ilyodon furcidens TaxID=33524 RepID=A0ABV0T1T0_9TELE
MFFLFRRILMWRLPLDVGDLTALGMSAAPLASVDTQTAGRDACRADRWISLLSSPPPSDRALPADRPANHPGNKQNECIYFPNFT